MSRELWTCGMALALTLALLPRWVLPPGRPDLRVPFDYGGDALLHLTLTKTLVEQGWFWQNPSLGAPGAMKLYEFPAVDTLPALGLKALSVFTHDPALLNNLFYLLTYPLASLAAFVVCRRLGVAVGPSILAGVLYAFLPYHAFRGETHLYLSAYFVVPPAVLVAWWVARGQLRGHEGRRRRWTALGICAVVSLAGVYYPFFAGALLGVAGLYAWGTRGDWRHGLAGVGLAALIAAGMLACLFPALRYVRAHPGVPASARYPNEAETFGLKVAQLLLPVDGHRLRPWRKTKSLYNQAAPLVNENRSASLGLVGAGGFLLLVGWLLFRPAARAVPVVTGESRAGPSLRALLDVFSVFNAAAVLWGTVGGFGALFALLVTPQLRAINRVSVFIAFFALAAAAAGLDALWNWLSRQRWPRPPARAWGIVGLLAWALLLGAGLLDQTPPANPARADAVRQHYQEDRHFFGRVAAVVPAGGQIFQLPYLSFPENGPVERLDDYSPLAGYVHAGSLRWSYGAMRGSAADQWQQAAAGLTPEACARRLALAGFDGVTLDTGGYADSGAAWAAGLTATLGPPAATGRGRLFFLLAEYARALRITLSPADWQRASDEALHRVYARFQTGFAAPTRREVGGPTLHWCAPEGELKLANPSHETRRVRVRMSVYSGRIEPARLTLAGGGVAAQAWTLTPQPQEIDVGLDLPPGECLLHFAYGNPGTVSAHPKETAWCLMDFRLEQADGG